ncbi:Glucan endo-1,3-alpha-glucosidase agn1 [Aspergillus tubingensis]
MSPGGAGNAFFTCTFAQDGVNAFTTTCPFDVDWLYNNYGIYYELINATAFWANLTATNGIQKDWVQFGHKDVGSSWGTIIEDALPGIYNLTETIYLTQILSATGANGGSMNNVLLTISTVVVFTLAQAVANMGEVVEVANRTSREKKKARIEEIIFGV